MPRLQNTVQQYITIKTTEMVGDRNTRKAKTTRVSQHGMVDYKKCDVSLWCDVNLCSFQF